MATLLYIRDVNNALLLLGISEEGESVRYKLSRMLYAEIGAPSKGAELSDETMEIIKRYDEEYRAKKKALSLLSDSDKNARGLKRRLSQAGFSQDVSEKCAEEMVSLGYIDEERQLKRMILNEANVKLRGPMKILPMLVSKGYASEDVRRIMHELSDSGEIDFRANAKKLLEKRLPGCDDRDEIKKLLYRNGYKI